MRNWKQKTLVKQHTELMDLFHIMYKRENVYIKQDLASEVFVEILKRGGNPISDSTSEAIKIVKRSNCHLHSKDSGLHEGFPPSIALVVSCIRNVCRNFRESLCSEKQYVEHYRKLRCKYEVPMDSETYDILYSSNTRKDDE